MPNTLILAETSIRVPADMETSILTAGDFLIDPYFICSTLRFAKKKKPQLLYTSLQAKKKKPRQLYTSLQAKEKEPQQLYTSMQAKKKGSSNSTLRCKQKK